MAGPDILQTIRSLAERNRIRFTRHASLRMWERNVSEDDVREGLRLARSFKSQDGGSFRVVGRDLDGDDLVVVIEEKLLIVTVF